MPSNFKLNTNKLTKALIYSSLLIISTLSKSESQVINVGSDPWCPFICDIDSNHQGLMVDLAKEALALSGFELNLNILNWARAKKMVQAGTLDGIIGMTLAPRSADYYYFPNTQLAESQTCFYGRVDDDWAYHQSVASLTNKTFGWINNYNYADSPLNDWIQQRKKTEQILTVAGNDTYARLFKLLSLKRIDTFADDKIVIAYEAKKAGVESKIKIAGCLDNVDRVHLAFSLKAQQKKKWAQALDAGIKTLRKTGKIDKILAFYGLSQKSWISNR